MTEATPDFAAMHRELDEARDQMRAALETREKLKIAPIFIIVKEGIHAQAKSFELLFEEIKNTETKQRAREVKLGAEFVMGRWLIETGEKKLRYLGRSTKGFEVGKVDPDLITLGDLHLDHAESTQFRAVAKLSAEQFAEFVASDRETSALVQQPSKKRVVLPLREIRLDERAQPRKVLHTDRVEEYAEEMKRGDKFPPLVVFEDAKGRYWLADGFHRHHAAAKLKLKTIECDVRHGGLRKAILYSCSANADHGLRRTNADKHQAVSRLLRDDEWSHWSDREIGRRCNVTHDFVGKVRAELTPPDAGDNASIKRTFTHPKTGNPTQMSTGNIGGKPGKPKASDAEQTPPAASDQPARDPAPAVWYGGIRFVAPEQLLTIKPSTPAPTTAPPEPSPAAPAPKPASPAQSDMFKPVPPPDAAPVGSSEEASTTPQKRWENELFLRMRNATSLAGSWDATYPGWVEFEPSEYIINAVNSIVAAWTEIAEKLKARRRSDAAA